MGMRRPEIDGQVLVIDASRMDVRRITRQLDHIGCIFLIAESRAEAIQLLKTNSHITVVLLDEGMANGCLADVVVEVKSTRSDVKIIGCGNSDCLHEFADAGVGEFLLKPWKLDELIDVLSVPEPHEPQSPDEEAAVDIHDDCEAEATTKSGDTALGKKAPGSDTASLLFALGDRLRIVDGHLTGITGTLLAERTSGKLLLELENGVFIEIHQFCVEKDSCDA
jgi:CheY-like chemotaxis protein